ncbi:hypothetical protein EDB84DRAFT_1438173 [Lactarius hengduanensis]|nr:hypothetical protein EDB84DRAFT_1438173 [Lactarius hengduanensis]
MHPLGPPRNSIAGLSWAIGFRPCAAVDFEYKEEHHLVEGVVHQYDPSEHEHEEWTKVKLEHVPLARVVAWRTSRAAGATSSTPSSGGKAAHPMEWTTVTDPTPLQAVPKIVQPISRQLPSDSCRLWESATSKLLSKEYGSCQGILRGIFRAVYRHLRKPGGALEAEIKYEHEDENEDGVERDNGGAPPS